MPRPIVEVALLDPSQESSGTMGNAPVSLTTQYGARLNARRTAINVVEKLRCNAPDQLAIEHGSGPTLTLQKTHVLRRVNKLLNRRTGALSESSNACSSSP